MQLFQRQDISGMETILEQERARSKLSPADLGNFLYGQEYSRQMKRYLEKGKTLPYTPNMYNKSRVDLIKDSVKYLSGIPTPFNHSDPENLPYYHRNVYSMLVNPQQRPASTHFGMFIKYIELMGTQEHKRLYLEKAQKCEILGSYAQTEVGHGSDIRNLQTTATYDPTTKEWIIDSPTASSAKYWPGELGLYANYAMVFAQTIIKGKNHGVNPFLVPVRDEDFNCLPGVEGGDIGPKIGFHAKDNGYMYFRNVRVPKHSLFTKYVEVSDAGDYKQVGDPRVGYGTMMFIREGISVNIPKMYASTIIIAARYSFFRRQGLGQGKEERNILEYQTQQEKVLPRLAEYYALTIAGLKIREICSRNGQKVMKDDFSLLQETHSNLTFSKCLFSQICQDGMEVLRRSMGGHGTSYYSGLPQMMNQYSANNTYEGQNTVMYLQTAQYVLKSFLGFKFKGKKLAESVGYIASFDELKGIKLAGTQPWTTAELRTVLVKSLSHILQIVGGKIARKKAGESEKDVINYQAGIRLQQLAQLHGVLFVLNQFTSTIDRENNSEIRQLMTHLCKLFTICQIQRLAEPIIEGGFICPKKWGLLDQEKETAMRAIRPHTAVLLDSFNIPDKYLRSEVVKGHPYQNFLDRARESQINSTVTSSALQVGKIHQVLAARPRL